MRKNMTQAQAYPIGTPGRKWGGEEKTAWLAKQSIKRSYQDIVVARIEPLNSRYDVEQYGALSYDPKRYPLLAIKTRDWDSSKPNVLITGGVHGYETSGVLGALAFLEQQALAYNDKFNIVVAPCVSPWGFETINRWNQNAVDPNRSFYLDSPAEESRALMQYIASLQVDITAHIDLHETTDSDNSEFRPALAARDNEVHSNWNIPDGFYLVGDTKKPVAEFQRAVIESVEQVTHIAPADEQGKLIGVSLAQRGVINYATKTLGLCAGFSDSKYCTTTEVYPDSPLVTDENCNSAQVAAITGALDYLVKKIG